jgi:hypothetical protein
MDTPEGGAVVLELFPLPARKTPFGPWVASCDWMSTAVNWFIATTDQIT